MTSRSAFDGFFARLLGSAGPAERGRGALLVSVIAIAGAIWAALILLTCLLLMKRGLDLTDESYYLLWIRGPQDFDFTATFFGAALHPIYRLAGGDLVSLRWIAFLLAAFSAILAWRCWVHSSKASWLAIPIALQVGALAAFQYAAWWLPTPSYNFLSVLAGTLLFSAFGLLMQGKEWPAASLAAIAGLLALAARPPTALSAAALYAFALAVASRDLREMASRILKAGAALMTFAVIVAVLVVDLSAILAQLRNYYQVWFATERFQPQLTGSLTWFLSLTPDSVTFVTGTLAGALVAFGARPDRTRWTKAVAVLALGSTAAGIGWFFVFNHLRSPSATAILASAAIPAMMAIAAFVEPQRDPRFHRLWFIAGLSPFVIFLGTGNSLPIMAPLAGAIPAILFLVIVKRTFSEAATVLAGFMMMALLTAALWVSVSKPYRLATPLMAQEVAIELPGHGAVLVDPSTRTMLETLQQAARNCRFAARTPVLDLSGASPGLVLALGGKPPGIAWIPGGYDWSDYLLGVVLQRMEAKDRARAWILTSDGERAFKTERLAEAGFDFPAAYEPVTTVRHSVFGWRMSLFAPRGDCQAPAQGRP